jgi:hypothetical protein
MAARVTVSGAGGGLGKALQQPCQPLLLLVPRPLLVLLVRLAHTGGSVLIGIVVIHHTLILVIVHHALILPAGFFKTKMKLVRSLSAHQRRRR